LTQQLNELQGKLRDAEALAKQYKDQYEGIIHNFLIYSGESGISETIG
jgi:hypothetical protein